MKQHYFKKFAKLFFFLVLPSILLTSPSFSQEVVSITAEDGLILKGDLYKQPKNAPSVLLMHQCNTGLRTIATAQQ